MATALGARCGGLVRSLAAAAAATGPMPRLRACVIAGPQQGARAASRSFSQQAQCGRGGDGPAAVARRRQCSHAAAAATTVASPAAAAGGGAGLDQARPPPRRTRLPPPLLMGAGATLLVGALALCKEEDDDETVAEHAAHLERIDARLHRAYPGFVDEHLIHQTLSGEDKIEDLRLYKDRRDGSIVAFVRLGKLLSGHPGVVHGGTLAAILDNTFGVAFFAAKVGNGFTANLTVNYRKPVTVGTQVKIVTRVERVEGRKVYLAGEIRDAEDDAVVYTQATCIFVTSNSSLLKAAQRVDLG